MIAQPGNVLLAMSLFAKRAEIMGPSRCAIIVAVKCALIAWNGNVKPPI